MKCNCLHWTIHIQGASLLPLVITKPDFVLSVSSEVWLEELANPLCAVPVPSMGLWRRQLLVALLSHWSQVFPPTDQRGPSGLSWKVRVLGLPFGGVKTSCFSAPPRFTPASILTSHKRLLLVGAFQEWGGDGCWQVVLFSAEIYVAVTIWEALGSSSISCP